MDDAPALRTGRRPGGRGRGDSGTRAAILAAARRMFPERGYAGSSLRAIAAEAGVTPPLVIHFFGSKAGLFAEAVDWPFDPREVVARVLEGDRERVGERLATVLVATWDVEGDRNAILSMLRSATSDENAARLLREFLVHELFAPLTTGLGHGDEAMLRAGLVASQLVGAALVRWVLRVEPLASMDSAGVVAVLAPTLQRYLTGPL